MKEPIQYYGLKEFAEIATDNGIKMTTEMISVYRSRGLLPEPAVMIGSKAGWTKEQINEWVKQKKIAKK